MNEKGIRHFIEYRAGRVAGYGIGDSANNPMPELALECIIQDLSYLEGEERDIYTSKILRTYTLFGVEVPANIYRLLK